jgi:lactate dehydrogenase-like 2-hydroxyacid dehydrogenase
METLVRIGEFPATLQAQIDREFRCLPVRAVLADDALRRGVRGLITRSNYQVPLAVVDQLPALRVIATSGVGHDGIPVVQALRKRPAAPR